MQLTSVHFHAHWWRTLAAFVEAFGGLLGIAVIGLCVLAFFFVADALWPKDEEADRQS